MLAQSRILAIKGSSCTFVFILVDDVVNGIVRSASTKLSGAFNVAGDGALSMREIATMLGKPARGAGLAGDGPRVSSWRSAYIHHILSLRAAFMQAVFQDAAEFRSMRPAMNYIAVRLVLLLLSALLTSGANAAELRKIVVLALMGDTLALVNHKPEVGSNLDRNQYSSVPTIASVLDSMMIGEAIEAVKRAALPGSPEIQALKYPGKYETARWFDGTRFAPPTEVGSAMTGLGATHLMFITPYRAPSMLKTDRSSIGSGHLEGLGFYMDREQRLRRADTGEVGVGFLAPYAYFKVFLIDLAKGEIEREQAVTASYTVSAARNRAGVDPWDALDAAQKVSAIRRLIQRELDRVVPKLLR